MAIIKPNNNTISAITALPAAISTGKVLKVAYGTTGTAVAVSSNTYTDAGFTTSITPTATDNHIYLNWFMPDCRKETNNTNMNMKIYRQVNGGGYSAVSDNAYFNTVFTNSGTVNQLCTIQFLDTPSYSLTNQIDYKLYMASSDGGTVNMYNEGGNKNNLLLWEIGA